MQAGRVVRGLDVRLISGSCADTVPQSNYRIVHQKKKKKRNGKFHIGHPPVEVAGLSLGLAVRPAGNRKSNLRNDSSHRNRGHCSRLDNPHNRNNRNHNL